MCASQESGTQIVTAAAQLHEVHHPGPKVHKPHQLQASAAREVPHGSITDVSQSAVLVRRFITQMTPPRCPCCSAATCCAVQLAKGEAKAQYSVLLCQERCHKNESVEATQALSDALEPLGGAVTCMKKARVMERWLSKPIASKPFILLTDWREAQPCMQVLSSLKPAADAAPAGPPALTVIFCSTSRQVKRASTWLSTLDVELVGPVVLCSCEESEDLLADTLLQFAQQMAAELDMDMDDSASTEAEPLVDYTVSASPASWAGSDYDACSMFESAGCGSESAWEIDGCSSASRNYLPAMFEPLSHERRMLPPSPVSFVEHVQFGLSQPCLPPHGLGGVHGEDAFGIAVHDKPCAATLDYESSSAAERVRYTLAPILNSHTTFNLLAQTLMEAAPTCYED
eukprot:TRINITY_DN44080_c0_g1_i1.p1 TRINITY_DN44080_c0_g1~~TRINITY_DN44080_c0_g1_i1.p1  ORF type:complete len:426 (-),score=99.58 TRINITY_DN44080_c0_g1_i1:366-1565(-)